jgi:hypothetical protein
MARAINGEVRPVTALFFCDSTKAIIRRHQTGTSILYAKPNPTIAPDFASADEQHSGTAMVKRHYYWIRRDFYRIRHLTNSNIWSITRAS